MRENLTLAALPALARLGVVDRARQREIVARFMQWLGIKATGAGQKIRELSGGNQQKVLLARWLCMHPALLILDKPTRGIDLGAKAEIQALINELAGAGLGVLMISSELEELVEGSSRVVGLLNGAFVAYFRVRAIVVTLATLLAGRGLAQVINRGGALLTIDDPGFLMLGRGYLGTVAGALIMQVIATSFNMLLVPYAWSLAFKAFIILFAVYLQRPRRV